MNSGIYCIENLVNGNKYIGQSANLQSRFCCHFSTLKNNKHENQHLQRAFNKYGKENFIFKILVYCELFELTRYEQFFIDLYPDKLYNIRRECVESNFGIKWSEESRKKASENHADFSGENHPSWGMIRSKETREKISKSAIGNKKHLGKPQPEEAKQKISKANKGKRRTPEQKEKPKGKIPWNKGKGKKYDPKPPKIKKPRKPPSDEWRKNKSKSMSGKNNPMYGKHLSKESIEKRNETRKRNKQLK